MVNTIHKQWLLRTTVQQTIKNNTIRDQLILQFNYLTRHLQQSVKRVEQKHRNVDTM